MNVIDFHHIPVGTVVKFSKHFCDQHEMKPRDPRRKLVGILTEKEVTTDKKVGITFYPIIHWEGMHAPSINHPIHIALFREPKSPPRMIDIAGDPA